METVNNNILKNDIIRSDYEKFYWSYYTNINPFVIKQDTNMLIAFDTFLKELCLDVSKILPEIEKYNKYVITINTEGLNDIIKNDQLTTYKNFLKSKFIFNKRLKQKIIDYYNNYDIFSKGPIRVSEHEYVIILSKLKEKLW